MAHALTGEEFEKIRERFFEMDTDKNGCVSIEAVKESLREVDMNGDQVDFFLSLLNFHDQGSIAFTDYLEVSAVLGYDKRPSKYQMKRFFHACDFDKNGFISRDEVKKICKVMCDDEEWDETKEVEVDEILKSADLNEDGKITYDEFGDQLFEVFFD